MPIESFDSLDDAFEFMRRQEQLANEAVTDEQRNIAYGDYWVRHDQPVVIYGYIMTREELEHGELEAGAEPDELVETMRVMDSSYARGYRFGRCYSEWEPEGELGSTHISCMIKITREQFEHAQSRGWR